MRFFPKIKLAITIIEVKITHWRLFFLKLKLKNNTLKAATQSVIPIGSLTNPRIKRVAVLKLNMMKWTGNPSLKSTIKKDKNTFVIF